MKAPPSSPPTSVAAYFYTRDHSLCAFRNIAMVRYVSPYGPKLRPSFNIMGYPIKNLRPIGISAAGFAAVAGGTVLFILEGVPRVQHDILQVGILSLLFLAVRGAYWLDAQKLPLIGSYWTGREKPASDNPF
ncbi:hypothetical protein B9Z19DRAFT_1196830 [Tuber borchii]|uniref:Uncharacterized protein n=1 Tax=Tuber borchii TaxID=42251 RepID=A0A2T6ZDS4_TUBBO|nr:hypothetical protein B9Z19DRAFT_1196830 [Tuber borchii]